MKCSGCGVIHLHKSRYCNSCQAEYMREWRKTHPLTEEQRKKDICRSYAGVYLRRNFLKKENCISCGDQNSQMHHSDYSKPLSIEWFCRPCHLALGDM